MRRKTLIVVALVVLVVGAMIYFVYRSTPNQTTPPSVSGTSWEGKQIGADGITWDQAVIITFHSDHTAQWQWYAVNTPESKGWRDGCHWQESSIVLLDCPKASPLGEDIAELKVNGDKMSGSFATSCQPGFFQCPPAGLRSWTVELHRITYLGPHIPKGFKGNP